MNVVDYKLFTDEERKNRGHTVYRLCGTQTGVEMTDKLEIHFIEMPKYNLTDAIDKNDKQALWVRLLCADTKEELDMLDSVNDKTLSKAVSIVRFMNNDEKLREQMRLKYKAEMDEAQNMLAERLEGKRVGRQERENEIILRLKECGMSEDEIRYILGNG